jgi:predicted metal-dependent hydrolase
MKARQAKATAADFRAQVANWAQRIRVKPRQVRLQAMRRKWASCSTAGTVSFSLDLLAQPAPFREYVIVHELLHLKVPNHGKLFKSLLRAYLPDYESISQAPPLVGVYPGKTLRGPVLSGVGS